MITQQLLEKFERYYGKGMARLVLFADWSGHIEVRDSAAWQCDFAFEDIAQLEAHLTKRALDGANESDQNTFRANISDFLQGKGQIPPRK